MDLHIADELEPFLDALSDLQVLGESPGEVAQHLLRESIAREMRQGGLLHRIAQALVEDQLHPVAMEAETIGAQVDAAFADAQEKAPAPTMAKRRRG